MRIIPVTDAAFKPYGKVLERYDTAELTEAMRKIPMPAQGTDYMPSIAALESCAVFEEFGSRAYGGMPIQIGMCWGFNTKLNCLEYHRDSEINIGTGSFILLLAKQSEIENGMLDTANVKAFSVPAGVPVEVYATTLHYAPCDGRAGEGFRVAVILPRGTNTEKPAFTIKSVEDACMTARNKWLLAHPDSNEAKNGARVGLAGINIDIKEDL